MGELRKLLKSSLTPVARALSPRRVDLPMELWGLSRSLTGELCLDGVALSALLEQFGSPLHLVDAERLKKNAEAFTATPAGASRACEVYYSYKTNPVPGVLKKLKDLNVGAEVISEYELWLALKLGMPPSRIVYNGPCKSDASLHLAVDCGLGLISVNSRPELERVAAFARRLGKRPRVGVRVVTPQGWSGQFGERIDTGAALAAFMEAVRHPELNVVGLHSHLGHELSTASQVTGFVDAVLDFAWVLRDRLGLSLEIIDLGGSLACRTVHGFSQREKRLNQTFGADLLPRAPESVLSIGDYTALVAHRIEDRYRAAHCPIPRIFLEPGRAMTGDTQMLLTTVRDVRDPEGDLRYAVLDAGTTIADPVPNEYHQLFKLGALNGPLEHYRLVGPICTPADVLYLDWELPQLERGDQLAIMDSGAYFVPFAASFSFPQPPVVMFENGEAQLMRGGERFDDLVRRDVGAFPEPSTRRPAQVPPLAVAGPPLQ
jgi:diaminopimelate decarboxylase